MYFFIVLQLIEETMIYDFVSNCKKIYFGCFENVTLMKINHGFTTNKTKQKTIL